MERGAIEYDIFLSYRRSDQKLATALVEALRAKGVKAWYDQMIQGGVDWREDIVGSLESSRILVILFSEECNSSRQLSKELAIADHLHKDVIPVLIEDTKPRGNYLYELAPRNWIEVHPRPERKVKELADRLAEAVREAQAAAPADQGSISETTRAKSGEDLQASVRRERALRDVLPFRWWDVVPLALVVGLLLLIDQQRPVSERMLGDLAGPARSSAIGLLSLAVSIVYGAIVFPVRYYLRNRGLIHSMVKYLVSNVILVALFVGAHVAWESAYGGEKEEASAVRVSRAPVVRAEVRENTHGPVVRDHQEILASTREFIESVDRDGGLAILLFAIIWLACGVVAFLIFALLTTQRAVRNFRKNKVTL